MMKCIKLHPNFIVEFLKLAQQLQEKQPRHILHTHMYLSKKSNILTYQWIIVQPNQPKRKGRTVHC